MMGGWGFVAAAYGIVWGAILVYLINLKRRYNHAAAELHRLQPAEASAGDEQK